LLDHQFIGGITQFNNRKLFKDGDTGTFDLVVQDDKGTENSRQSLNQSFGNKELLFNGPVNLIASDYNADNLFDIPIGFPVSDGSTEYKYVIFSVGKGGKIITLPVTGYKEDGFVYSAAGGYSTEFPRIIGYEVDRRSGILIGVEKDSGGFEPAEYLWNGEQFEFKKENPFIITRSELNVNNKKYLITIVQTEYKKPLKPNEQGFSILESMYRGRFDLLVQDSKGKVTSQVSLNKYFGNDDLGYGGAFPLVFKDYNQDGDYDFIIGRPDQDKVNPEFQNILLSIDSEGIVYNLPAVGYKEDGYIYSAGGTDELHLLDKGEIGVEVTLSDPVPNGYTKGKYLWNGSRFVFSN
jgi:hypothetical protein